MKIQDKNLKYLIWIGLIFVVIYSWLPLNQLLQANDLSNFNFKFNTPDEVLNYYFTQNFAENFELFYFEPLNPFLNRVIFPRWALVIEGMVTPGNFLGMDLIYGSLAKIFSIWIIPFLTPIFSVMGILFFYLIVRDWSKNKNLALMSAILLLIFPGWWYFSSRTMFSNVLFLSLVMGGIYFLLKFLNSEKTENKITNSFWYSILIGLFFGLALSVRTSEIVWLFLLVLILLIFNFKKLKDRWQYLILSLGIFVACFIPVMYQNKILYNNYLSTGYNLNTMTENLESGEVSQISYLKAVFLPFGFHPRVMVSVFKNYFVKLFWLWIVLFVMSVIWFFKKKKKLDKNQICYLIILLVVSCWLLVVYGSWYFSDSIGGLISLGSSYVRYFLPIFVLIIPTIAWLLIKIKKKIFLIIIFCLIFGFSFYQVFWQNDESLSAINLRLLENQKQSEKILGIINENDIILMDSGTDKIIMPEHTRMIVPQNDIEWEQIKRILKYQPIYYYHHKEIDVDILNSEKFEKWGLGVERIENNLFLIKNFNN